MKNTLGGLPAEARPLLNAMLSALALPQPIGDACRWTRNHRTSSIPFFPPPLSCPSNLGTGMRASVMICLKNLTADSSADKASAIAKPYGLSVRGTGGEHTPVVNHMASALIA